MIPRRMTELAHHLLRPHLQAGDVVIDATAGMGHDTLFLADAVGPTGIVFALDVQEVALAATRERLARAQCDSWLTLLHSGHEQLAEVIPAEHHGKVKAILFNLGYLPGADKDQTTHTNSTLQALEAALPLLSDQGVLSIVVYPGHEEGARESEALQEWISTLEEGKVLECRQRDRSENCPCLLLISKN